MPAQTGPGPAPAAEPAAPYLTVVIPAYRHVIGRVFNKVVQLLAIRQFADTQCGFKCFSHAAAQDLFQRVLLYGENAGPVKGPRVTGFDVEVLYLALKRGYRVKEVPV